MYGNRDFGQSFAPVKIGDEVDVKIEAVGEKGDGIAKVKGFVIFVPGVKEGEEVKIRINKVLRKVGFGEVIGKSEGKLESKKKNDDETEEFEESTEETSEEEPTETKSTEESEDFGE